MLLVLSACGSGSGGNKGTASGNRYYIDASAGSDSNDGISPDTAWQSLQMINNGNLTTPATIYLKRGERWHESLLIRQSNITLDAYGTGSLPLLDGSVGVDRWLALGNGIYQADITLSPTEGFGNIRSGSNMLSFLPWLGNVTATFSGASNDTYSYDNAQGLLYIKSASPGGAYRASRLFIGIKAEGVSDISLNNLSIESYSLHAVQFYDCKRCSARGMEIAAIGGAVIANNRRPGTLSLRR